MSRPSFYAEAFHGIQEGWSFDKGEYEDCIFRDIQLPDVDLSECTFINCQFYDSDFSMADVENTAFRLVHFEGCKLIGIRFDMANPLFFEVNFTHCQLRLATFYGWKMPETVFKNCGLQEVDFGGADLKGAVMNTCDLKGAMFEQTTLSYVDFRGSFNFSIDPEKNNIQRAKFSREEIGGLLDKYDLTLE